MKYISLLVLFAFSQISVHAGVSYDPALVVSVAISSAQNDKLSEFIRSCDLVSIASDKRHPLSPQEVLKFLKGIDSSRINLKLISENGKIAHVRMTGEINMDVDLSREDIPNGPSYRIIGIHP